MTARRAKPRREIRQQRRRGRTPCWNHLIAAPLWPKFGVNLGTLLRTCDAVGACLAVPVGPTWIDDALAHGNTLRRPPCIHRVSGDPLEWLRRQHEDGVELVGAELCDESIRLLQLTPARQRTVLILGHETTGIPADALDLLDIAVEIPMIGSGDSLNVAVAGSLLLYRLAGLC